jgi:hypothetical protein
MKNQKLKMGFKALELFKGCKTRKAPGENEIPRV